VRKDLSTIKIVVNVYSDAAFLLKGLRTSSSWASSPSGTRKRKAACSDSIRSKGLEKDHEFNVRWLRAARRVLKPDGTLWVSGTHHFIFSIGFALQRLGFKIINTVAWEKPDPVPNALHTAFTHAHETLIWASKGKRHTFNYDLINSPDPTGQVSSVWRIQTVPRSEKFHGYHPTQKPLKLVRRTLLASTQEGDLVFDPFCGSGTTAVAAKELDRFFVGAELEEEYCELAGRRIRAAVRGILLREISEQRWCATPVE
jgi:site-specific DNA-methyltransferase (adenine-specific)